MTAKQSIKLFAVVFSSYCISYLLIYFLADNILNVLDEVVSASLTILTIACAMSFAMFTYVDNMAKDLTDVRNDVNREKYLIAHSCLSSMKREVLANVAFIIFIFILERVVKFFTNYAEHEHIFVNNWLLKTSSLSFRFSLLTVVIFATFSQLSGFLIAVHFRELIAINRK